MERALIERSIPERFKEQVERAPDGIAVRTRTCQLSYARRDSWSDAIAADLLERLDASQEPVPFLLPQGPLAIAATIGILKAGKFYVPIDPSWGTTLWAVHRTFHPTRCAASRSRWYLA